MNKMKVMVIAVLVLVLEAFSLNYLHAEEVKAFDQCSGTYKTYTSEMNKKTIKIKESKLTSLRYLKKICKVTNTYKGEDYTAYELDNGRAIFYKAKGMFVKIGVVNVDNEVYGRVVFYAPGLTITSNLHDTTYSVKGTSAAYLGEDDVEDMVKTMKDLAIELALEF